MNLFINIAAAAIAENRRLEVATKYQSMLPEEYRERLRIEVQRIIDERVSARNSDRPSPTTVKTKVADATVERDKWKSTPNEVANRG